MAYALNLVDVNVNVVRAPQPSTLQRSGALISVGGTILENNEYAYCGSLQDVLNLLNDAGNSLELEDMANDFFRQGKNIGLYVLELGANSDSASLQMRALQTWLNLNVGIFYAFTTPVSWDGSTEDSVEAARMTNTGSGYALNPTATVQNPPGGEAAIIEAVVNTTTGGIDNYIIKNGSFGYTQNQAVTVSAPFPGGTQATAEAIIDGNGTIVAVNPINAGSLYSTVPNVVFGAPTSGITATGNALVNALGQVYKIEMTENGTGYNGTAPSVTIDAPPAGGTQAVATAILSYPLTTLMNNFSSATSKLYFFVTSSVETLANYETIKSAYAVVPSPNAASTDSPAAAMMAVFLSNNPAANNPLKPMNQRTLIGATPYPQNNDTNADINYIINLGGNIVDTGAQGGIPNTLIAQGYLMNGMQSNWWYGVDWFLITAQRLLAAAIIQGAESNPPLLYNSSGIRALWSVLNSVAESAVSFGCLNDAVVKYIPFQEYVTANPGDYANGAYNGFTVYVVGQNGFTKLTFNVTAFESFIPEELTQGVQGTQQTTKIKSVAFDMQNTKSTLKKHVAIKEVKS